MFIVFEGVDGVGKSSHIRGVSNFLVDLGIPHVCTSEFGNLPLGKSIRNLIMNYDLIGEEELFLINAIRSYHSRTVLNPAIKAGQWILMDRFIESTWAYQHGGKEISEDIMNRICSLVEIPKPDLTILLEGDNHRSKAKDKFDGAGSEFFNRVINVYKKRFNDHNWVNFNTNSGYKNVQEMIQKYLKEKYFND